MPCFKIGRIVIAALNFNDASPANNAAIFDGLPKPNYGRVPFSGVTASTATRFLLTIDGQVQWDGNGVAGWTNALLVYVCQS